jgi:hypothetical protein
VDLFHVLYRSGSMCVGVTVWFGWGGVVCLCRLKQCFTCFIISLFTAQHVSNASTSILKSLRLVDLFRGLYCSGSDVCWCYGLVRLGWCGILMWAKALLFNNFCVLLSCVCVCVCMCVFYLFCSCICMT